MKNFHYKDYYIMLERQHNGSICAVASSDDDRFGVVFYDYPLSYVVSKMKKHCKYRIDNNIKQY
jgi:hypothetical protein